MTATTEVHDPASSAPPSNQRFVDAALDLFTEHGYNGTSLQMIGDRLGVSKAAVTYHFRSKDELLAAAVGPAFADLAETLDRAEAVKRESARRREALEAYIDYLIRHRRVASWLTRDAAALTHESVLERAQELSARIDRLLTDASDDPIDQVWGAALTQALAGPMLSDIDLPDDVLRAELESIGTCLIRGHRSARRRAGAPVPSSNRA